MRKHVVSQMIDETEEEALVRYCKHNDLQPEDDITYLYGAWIYVDRGRR